MSTPSLTKHILPGALGDLFVDVLTGDRDEPRPAVLIIHGFKGFKDWGMFPPLAERLARAGFTAVSFNLSGSGVDDDGEFSLVEQFSANTFRQDLEDIDTAIEALLGGALGFPTPSGLGLVGHSRGGGEAILKGEDPRIGAFVAWATVSTFRRWSDDEMAEWKERGVLEIRNARTGQVLPIYDQLRQEIEAEADGTLNIVAAAGRVRAPLLMIHGDADETIPLAEPRRVADSAAEDSEFVVLEGAGHTFGAVHPFKGMTPHLEEAIDRTIGWFSRHLQ